MASEIIKTYLDDVTKRNLVHIEEFEGKPCAFINACIPKDIVQNVFEHLANIRSNPAVPEFTVLFYMTDYTNSPTHNYDADLSCSIFHSMRKLNHYHVYKISEANVDSMEKAYRDVTQTYNAHLVFKLINEATGFTPEKTPDKNLEAIRTRFSGQMQEELLYFAKSNGNIYAFINALIEPNLIECGLFRQLVNERSEPDNPEFGVCFYITERSCNSDFRFRARVNCLDFCSLDPSDPKIYAYTYTPMTFDIKTLQEAHSETLRKYEEFIASNTNKK